VCFAFFLGLLGFELEIPTANTESTLRGLNARVARSINKAAAKTEYVLTDDDLKKITQVPQIF